MATKKKVNHKINITTQKMARDLNIDNELVVSQSNSISPSSVRFYPISEAVAGTATALTDVAGGQTLTEVNSTGSGEFIYNQVTGAVRVYNQTTGAVSVSASSSAPTTSESTVIAPGKSFIMFVVHDLLNRNPIPGFKTVGIGFFGSGCLMSDGPALSPRIQEVNATQYVFTDKSENYPNWKEGEGWSAYVGDANAGTLEALKFGVPDKVDADPTPRLYEFEKINVDLNTWTGISADNILLYNTDIIGIAVFEFDGGIPTDYKEALQWMNDQWRSTNDGSKRRIFPNWSTV